MKIIEKIQMGRDGLIKNGSIKIVAFGDSVTHGAVTGPHLYHETVYHNRLKNMIYEVRDYVPVTVINSGIGGITASQSLCRLDSQVLAYNPDLVIVCFGLNDVNEPLETFVSSLETIFKKCVEIGADVIYMSPNMLNDRVADDTEPHILDYAKKTAEYQNSGKMDTYINSAIETAKKTGATVCDCYGEWKKLAKTQDITTLLANRINHPTVQMHELFARMLFNTIFENCPDIEKTPVSTMFNGK